MFVTEGIWTSQSLTSSSYDSSQDSISSPFSSPEFISFYGQRGFVPLRVLRVRCVSVACQCVSRRLAPADSQRQNKMAAGTGALFARKEALNRLETALKKFPPLLDRDFIICESEGRVSEDKTSEFRVLQWNVLADGRSSCSSKILARV